MSSATRALRAAAVALVVNLLGCIGGVPGTAGFAPPSLALAQGARGEVLAVALDPPRGDVRLVVLGDFNGPYGAIDYPPGLARALDAIVSVWLPDLVLSPGDVVAGQSRELPDERFPAMWAAFDAAVAGPLRAAGVRYAVAPGNHDASSARERDGSLAFARDRDAAAAYWHEHPPGLDLLDAAEFPFEYAFAVPAGAGSLYVAVIDASGALVTREQRDRLAAALRSDAARSAALRVVVGHLPLLPVSQGRDVPGEYLFDGAALATVLLEGGTDLYVSGHHAAYYAGTWHGLELLFAGGVGGRRLLGSSAAPRSTVTVVDVWFEVGAAPRLAYTTFDLSTMAVVEPSELPTAIGDVRLSSRAWPHTAAARDD